MSNLLDSFGIERGTSAARKYLEPVPTAEASAPAKTVRILVVDDEPGAGERVRALLGGAGYESVWVERGDEALNVLSRVAFDLVITELGLTGMSGIQLCHKARALRPGIPVIVYTGAASVPAAVDSFRAGAADFVNKNGPAEALVESLTRALERPETKGTPQRRSPKESGEFEALCSMEEVERQHVTRVLDAVGGNKREAARILKLDRTTLYRKLKRYGIPNQRRSGDGG